MKKLILLAWLLCLLIPPSLYAQLVDDFSDGDLSHDPAWFGDIHKFCVNTQHQLQLNDNAAGSAGLSTRNILPAGAVEWRISVKLNFAPSANNCAYIYLCTNTSDYESSDLQAFFLKLGEAGSQDAIELYYQENGNRYLVLRGTTSIANPFALNIKVTKDTDNLWHLFVDPYQNGVYIEECSAYGFCNIGDYQYFGLQCFYTASNSNKFFFDDIYCGQPLLDTTPPHLVSIVAPQQNQLLLTFSKAMDSKVLQLSNYELLPSRLAPSHCEWQPSSQESVTLTFPTTFQEKEPYLLKISDLQSWNHLIMPDTQALVRYYHIFRNEVIISEFMADPRPAVGLPDCEYIELFNRLDFDVTLSQWKLKMGSSQRLLPDLMIPARSQVCILPDGYRERFPPAANIATVSSLSIADEEQQMTLYDENEQVIFHLEASSRWHENDLKRAGGWSLEICDVDNPCGGSENWVSSRSPEGGTPAAPNSVQATNPDTRSPRLERVVVESAQQVRVIFDEPIAVPSVTLPTDLFQIDRGVEVVQVQVVEPASRSLWLTVQPPLQAHVIYTLTLQGVIDDCAGNVALHGSFQTFALPLPPAPHDLIINELLFNPPESSDATYLELYNCSDKVLDMRDIFIGTGSGDLPKSVIPLVPDGKQLFPKQYLAVCKDRAHTLQHYPSAKHDALVENPKLPVFPNSGTTIYLLNAAQQKIDLFTYSEEMHYPLLRTTDGVALERLHLDGNTQDPNNWTSAAESCGWGTPGGQNSQFSAALAPDETMTIAPTTFSPDQDGVDDYAEIYCHFADLMHRVSINIYDRNGFKVRALVNNQPCGAEEHFRWDGSSDQGTALPAGVYLVKLDYWNGNGCSKTLKRCVTLVRRL